MIMSASFFQITEHVIPCQHIREYPHAVKSEQGVLQLAIKEYKPLDNLDASPGSLTLLATHANGLPKVENIQNPWCCATRDMEYGRPLTIQGNLRASVG
jgi:hypothetical protein